MTLTTEAVLALAPDSASAKAAQGLVSPAKWPLLGASDAALWGECQGSGAKPYQAQIDLAGPAFRCSCPSRKFPCKHGLALLLLRVQGQAGFSTGEAPAWVREWLDSRAEKVQKKEERQQEKAATPADPDAARQREAQRWARIEGAAAELQRWLADQLARGLAALNTDALQGWQTMAARMVDGQAPGLGARVREAAAGVQQGEDWPERTLQRLGLLQLVCESLGRRASLPPALQAALRAAAGWPQDKGEVLAQGEQVADHWTVLGCHTLERDDRLTERHVWLQGRQTGRRALVLDHAFGGRGFEQTWPVGSVVAATLAWFAGAGSLRVLGLAVAATAEPPTWPDAPPHSEWAAVAGRVADCPWSNLHPLVLADAVVLHDGQAWQALAAGRAIPLLLGEADGWTLMACAGGHPVHLMGEWDGHALLPLTAWSGRPAQMVWQRSLA